MLSMPFVVFVAWRLLAPTSGPPRVLVIAVSLAVVSMAGLLLVLWYEEAEPPGTGYVPARLDNGRVVPSHVERPGTTRPAAAGSPSVPDRND
jgi:hypothetical protein